MDTSDPYIYFDENGRSNHFLDFHNITKKNWFPNLEGKRRLKKAVERIKKESKGNDFDCILGVSGGLDSSYMLHKMVTEYGLKPLLFHVDGGWDSEIAVRNIKGLIDKLNLELFTEVINWEEMREFQLAMFKSGVPHIDVPQDMAFVGALYKYAEKFNIKTILNGGNISTESVLVPLDFLYWPTDMVQVKDILKRYCNNPMKTYPFSSIYYTKIWIRYLKRIKVFKPLNFMVFNYESAINELNDFYGWKPYGQKHFESRFTRFFEGYWLPTRFGYDMRRSQLSGLILTNQMSRKEALDKLKSPPLDENTIRREFDYVAKKLDIEVSELEQYHSMPKKFYWDYANQKLIFKIGEKILALIAKTARGGAY